MQFLLTFKTCSLSIEPTAGESVAIWLHSRLRVSRQGSRDSSGYVIVTIMQCYVLSHRYWDAPLGTSLKSLE